MAETCIVCLSELRFPGDGLQQSTGDAEQELKAHDDEAHAKKRSLRNTRLKSKSIDDDDEIVAHLLPCKHNLHNACLKPWVERANSCPICRATFNTVELSTTIGGEVIDTYAVQDKVQKAEFDPAAFIETEAEEELFEWDGADPCTICDTVDDSHDVTYCHGCDANVHVFCAGYNEAPDVWHCPDCLTDMGMVDVQTQRRPPTSRQRARARQAQGEQRGRNDAQWARVWQEVSQRLDLDLDFPFNDEGADYRTEEQRREFNRWQRRFQVADRQGSARRLRGIAARFQPPPAPPPTTRPAPESQDEIRAWNAFEKARESQEDLMLQRQQQHQQHHEQQQQNITRKRRRTESPASAQGTENNEQRQLKRPRLRRPPTHNETLPLAESSTSAAQRGEEPTFLSSLLREVEQKPVSAASPDASEGQNGPRSPRNSSPAASSSSSGHVTPRALSVTPPPRHSTSPPRHSASPPLCSTISPPISVGLTFSPCSPTSIRPDSDSKRHQRGRARVRPSGALQTGLEEDILPSSPQQSPDRDRGSKLTLASKEEIARMVKVALRPRYRDKQLNKDQYTDINRDISRRMYELIGDATALADEDERARWQHVAEQEVQRAITSIAQFNATALDTSTYES